MKNAVKQAVREHKLIAIARGVSADTCLPVARALYEGGIRLMELPYDQKHPETWEATAQAVGKLAQAFEGRMYIGAGTVTSPALAELTYRRGGHFVVAPDTNEAVIRRANALGLTTVPGALTPTEIMTAHRAGADFVKLFPAGNLGLGYVRSITAPLSHVELLVFGGIDETNLRDYLSLGITGAGIGGTLVNPDWVRSGDYGRITRAARLLVEAAK